MGSTPKPPDPYAMASAQNNSNLFAGQASNVMNNPNQYGPWGQRTTTQSGWQQIFDPNSGKMVNVPRYNETTKLSPDEQRIYGLNTQTRSNMGQTAVEQSAKLRGLLGQSVSTEGLEGWAKGQAPGEVRQDQAPTDRAGIESAIMSRYNTDSAKQNAAQEAKLAARGMAPGSQGYGSVQEQQDRSRTDAMNQAYLASGAESRAAQGAYNQAGLQRYQMGQDYAGSLNNLRQGQLQERLGLRNQPLNEITALLSGTQVNMPQFSPFSRQGFSAAPIGNYMEQNYAQQAQASANQMQGAYGLGGAAITGLFGL